MTLKLYTLRGKLTGTFYYARAHTMHQAALQLGIRPKNLILERSEVIKPQGTQILQDPSISSHTAQYRSPRK